MVVYYLEHCNKAINLVTDHPIRVIDLLLEYINLVTLENNGLSQMCVHPNISA